MCTFEGDTRINSFHIGAFNNNKILGGVSLIKNNCDENGENCMEIPQKQCSTTEVLRLKSIPSTSCDQAQVEICTTPACPLVSYQHTY